MAGEVTRVHRDGSRHSQIGLIGIILICHKDRLFGIWDLGVVTWVRGAQIIDARPQAIYGVVAGFIRLSRTHPLSQHVVNIYCYRRHGHWSDGGCGWKVIDHTADRGRRRQGGISTR